MRAAASDPDGPGTLSLSWKLRRLRGKCAVNVSIVSHKVKKRKSTDGRTQQFSGREPTAPRAEGSGRGPRPQPTPAAPRWARFAGVKPSQLFPGK